MCNNHLELGMQESAEANEISSFSLWCEQVEKILGHDLDGIEWVDGFSIDYANDAYNAGMSVDHYVDRVNRTKALIEKGEYIHVIKESCFKTYSDDGEPGQHDEITLYVGKATDEYIERYIEENYPSEHCQHEYDCCGQWYAMSARYKRRGNIAIVTQAYLQNV